MKQYYRPPGAASFHSMDWMLQEFNLDINEAGIYHIGAHTGFDAYIYHGLGAKHIVWVECNPYLTKDLKRIVEEYQEKGFDDKWFDYAIWHKSGLTKDFYFFNNHRDGCSSLFPPGGIEEKIPTVKYMGEEECVSVETITLDLMIWKHNLSWDDVRLFNIDVQGAELNVLKGADRLLSSESLKYIICEVSYEPLYEGGATAQEIDEYLKEYNFKLLYFREDCIPTHGDAIYVR